MQTPNQPILQGMENQFSLYDYRQKVSELYHQSRRAPLSDDQRCLAFRRGRDVLFATHEQSALSESQKHHFSGLDYYPYNPAYRFVLPIQAFQSINEEEVDLGKDGKFRYSRAGKIQFSIAGVHHTLTIYWVAGYGGGLFLPFCDLTNGRTTYEGGRYLIDTIKGADLGKIGESLIVDFNYAYNPSCAYNPRWTCPLSPLENHLSIAIPAGEKMPVESWRQSLEST